MNTFVVVSCAVFSVLQLLNLAGATHAWNPPSTTYSPRHYNHLAFRGYGNSDLMQADDPYKLSRRSLFNNQDTVTDFGLNNMNADYKKSAEPYKSSKSLSRRSLSNNLDTVAEFGLNNMNADYKKSADPYKSSNGLSRRSLSNNQNTNSGLGLNQQMGSTAAFGRLSETTRIPNCRLSGQEGANTLGELSKLGGNSDVRRVSMPNGAGERREFNSGSESVRPSKSYEGRGRREGSQLGRMGEFGGQGKFSGNSEMGGIGGSGGMSGIGGSGRLSGANGFSGMGGFRESGEINNIGGISGTGEEFQSMPFN